ncbi:MAG: hypothetical protein ACLU6V_04670 [Lancefieldella rimae]
MAFFTGDKNSKKVQEAQRVATRAARAQEEEVSRTVRLELRVIGR